jgi:LacI family gluconate utilization system Gnt-I transcriptional repressor
MMVNQATPASVTLADVARKAGVSVITASRALRTPGLVAPATRARIEAAVASLGYVPNLVAGALASARTRNVALLVPTIASSIFAGTINGLSDLLEAEGYAILMAQSGYDAERERRALAALLGRRPEALVMVGSPATDEAAAMLHRAAAEGTIVVETWELPQAPVCAVVGFDNDAVGRTVARHFADTGRRRLVFLGGPDARAAARFAGFQAGARKARLAPPERIVLPAPAAMDDAAGAISNPALARADAVFTATDVHGVGLLSALRAAGRRVPHEIAVVGLGDLEIARHAAPPLSTVRIDGAAIGRHAAMLVLGGSQAAAGRVIDLGYALVPRGTG